MIVLVWKINAVIPCLSIHITTARVFAYAALPFGPCWPVACLEQHDRWVSRQELVLRSACQGGATTSPTRVFWRSRLREFFGSYAERET